MLRPVGVNFLLASLAPHKVTTIEGTFQVSCFVELPSIKKTRGAAPVTHCKMQTQRFEPHGAYLRHSRRTKNSDISISIHISYCSMVIPMLSTSSRVTSTAGPH